MDQIHSAPMGKQTQITVRFPEEWVPRIDAIAKAMSRPGVDVSRTDALRFIVSKGIDGAESELSIAKPKAKR